jgi:4-carboxymuconolactone decarboxylase
MSRIPPLTPGELDDAQQELYDEIVGGPRGRRAGSRLLAADGSLRGPFNAFLLSPVVGSPFQRIGAALRFETELSADARELAILVVAARWSCEFEWNAHVPIALEAGVDQHVVDSIAAGDEPRFLDRRQALVHRVAREALDDRTVGSETYAALEADLGRRSTFELLAVIGYYSMLALVLNGFDVRFD